MSNKDNSNHPNHDEFEMGSGFGFDETEIPEGDDYPIDGDFANSEINLDQAPTVATRQNRDSGHFSDVEGEQDEEGEDGSMHHEGHEGHEEQYQEGEEIPQPQKSLLSKLLFPIGGAIATVCAAGLGYMVLGNLINGDEPSNNATPAPTPAPRIQTPVANGQNPTAVPSGPRLPVAGQNQTVMPQTGMNTGTPKMPVSQPMPSQQSPRPAQQMPGMPNNIPVDDGNMSLPPSGQPMQANPVPSTPPTGVSPAIEEGLRALIGEIHTMNGNFKVVSDRVEQTRSAMMERFDQTDGRIADIGGRINNVDQKVGGLESRVAALESGRNASKPTSTPNPSVASGPSRVLPPAQQASASSSAKPMSSPAVKPTQRTSHGYVLRGVSRDAVVLQSSGGVRMYSLGQEIPGLGVAQEIKMDGKVPYLVTSGGIVRP